MICACAPVHEAASASAIAVCFQRFTASLLVTARFLTDDSGVVTRQPHVRIVGTKLTNEPFKPIRVVRRAGQNAQLFIHAIELHHGKPCLTALLDKELPAVLRYGLDRIVFSWRELQARAADVILRVRVTV